MRLLCFILFTSLLPAATLTPQQRTQNVDSFNYVWKTIRDKHWDKSLDGPEWQRAHDELLPKVQQAESVLAARAVIEEMIGKLHLTHFGIIPGDLYSRVKNGSPANLDVRVVGVKPLIVSGKYTGWEVLGMEAVITRVGKLYEHSTVRDMMLSRAIAAEAAGKPIDISDGQGKTLKFDPDSIPLRGEPVTFGFLPTQYVWVESRTIENTGYVAFNEFMDPERLIDALKSQVAACAACDGFIVDLRGNPGGIGGMAMGMAGFFVSKPNQQLGVMTTRQQPLKFFINPRAPQFAGPVAILVDGLSASTSEIFAGGLQDLGRARIFGSRTAGAALPSVVERLPNGDAFQYAIANYISEGGKALEGIGVTPDVAVLPSQPALLAGHDLVLEAALKWIAVK